MPVVSNGDVDLYFETAGDLGGRPLLLVCGLGSQLTTWEELVDGFVERGYFVVVFDNRDVGLSTKLDHFDSVETAISAMGRGEDVDAPYLLSDMADDAAAVLSAAGVEAAHVCGVSMGGMVAQQFALQHTDRTLSLISVMSTTGDPDVGRPTSEAVATLLVTARDREGVIELSIESSRVIGSPGHLDEEWERRRAEVAFDRCHHPAGVGRQLLAVVSSGSRSAALRDLDVPTVVVHGAADPLVSVDGGERTAEIIADAELMVIAGMGHNREPAFWSVYYEAVARAATRADARADPRVRA